MSLDAFKLWESMILGEWWNEDPAEGNHPAGYIPRVMRGVPDRVNRLKGTGNGQVPCSLVLAWDIMFYANVG
jgi:hypothetical protein